MNYLIHATPLHLSLCLQYLIPLSTIVTAIVFISLLPLLFCYCYYYKTVATDKLLWASLFSGAAELTTYLLRLINILWLPLCRINKFGFYLPQRLLRSPILVGHQYPYPFCTAFELSPSPSCYSDSSATTADSRRRRHASTQRTQLHRLLWRARWYVSNVSIIFDAPCLFLHHLLCVLLHFVAFLCIF
jgi:hypothetical protein